MKTDKMTLFETTNKEFILTGPDGVVQAALPMLRMFARNSSTEMCFDYRDIFEWFDGLWCENKPKFEELIYKIMKLHFELETPRRNKYICIFEKAFAGENGLELKITNASQLVLSLFEEELNNL